MNEKLNLTNEFENLKNAFNIKVKEKNMIEIFKLEDDEYDSYEAASILVYLFPQIQDIVSNIRNTNLEYNDRKIKELATIELANFIETNDYLPSFSDKVSIVIDNYFLYESCGYFNVLEKQNNFDENNNVKIK